MWEIYNDKETFVLNTYVEFCQFCQYYIVITLHPYILGEKIIINL